MFLQFKYTNRRMGERERRRRQAWGEGEGKREILNC